MVHKNDRWWKRGCSIFGFKYRIYGISLENKAHFYTLKNTFTALYEATKKFKLIGGKKSVMKSLVFNTKTQVCPKIGTLQFKHLSFLSFKRLNG